MGSKRVLLTTAVAAAGAQTGAWAVYFMEREDGDFAAPVESLELLTGIAPIAGREQMSQVLSGVVSGKPSVRDMALTALMRLSPLTDTSLE